MALSVVRAARPAERLLTSEDVEDYEQELVDQFLMALAAAGISDGHAGQNRSVAIAFIRFLGRPIWTATVDDADRFMVHLRKSGQARTTVAAKATELAHFFDFLITRYQGEILELTGVAVTQPIDDFNRPAWPRSFAARIPPSDEEVELLFAAWRASLPVSRKYLTSARDYMAASLWRRLGLRINETCMLDMRDWRPDLGKFGKVHVRFGKGSQGRGHKPRLVPAINLAGEMLDWWVTDVRHQYGDDWINPDAPLFPSERYDKFLGGHKRVQDDALRTAFKSAVQTWLPIWSPRLTPHVMRHYCASSLYGNGMPLKAIQELMGHEWLNTTTTYLHVRDGYIEQAWIEADSRVATRFGLTEG
jgi:integrase/recombinase XerC